MPKPKAPRWLTQAFANGVGERDGDGGLALGRRNPSADGFPRYHGACWLAQHDERRRPCSGRLERAHLIPRQRVENALRALLPVQPPVELADGTVESWPIIIRDELILLAAWDPRNAVIGCEGHHRRFDNHATPALVVPQMSLPFHVFEFACDWGLRHVLNDRFPLHLP